ncbi:DUF4922 domain-containing protein [Dysgonomonas alginatilytica]|uniref:DUF4922 domain-containing protein n=1 Tax=Dysgonomonas alginatilytica TaxID=1605892 RepID=UPI0037436948
MSKAAEVLLQEQLQDWDLAKDNYAALAEVKTKDFSFGDFTIRVQFNPARIQSSAAKVDTKSIQERKCFLCPQNLPEEQKNIPFNQEYEVLVNPYPIFPKHFTIPTYTHTDQLVLHRFSDMLDLTQTFDGYVIFYNGPKCGASAPDHAHFQAGSKGFLPLEKDMKTIRKEILSVEENLNVYTLKDYLRNGFLIESKDKNKAVGYFEKLYSKIEIKEGEKEPMLNILSWYEEGSWFTCIFPREKHRPSCYFAEGEDNILISPGSVDLGGVFITPVEKDFNKINKDDIIAILKEICISDKKFNEIIEKLKSIEL